jgi:hypothetical protein
MRTLSYFPLFIEEKLRNSVLARSDQSLLQVDPAKLSKRLIGTKQNEAETEIRLTAGAQFSPRATTEV